MDKKTSFLINKQIPEFIREEHPKFISFLEAYYEFLESKQTGEQNDLTKRSKDLRYISDIDESLDDFEDNFFNVYMSLLPKEMIVNKEFLLKNVLPIYLAKGNEKSFKLLFRLLFGESAEISNPRDRILRASDGKWYRENSIRIDPLVETFFVLEENTKNFPLLQEIDDSIEELSIFVDDVVQESGFYIIKELKRLVFDSEIPSGSTVKIKYSDFNFNIIENRRLIGESSGAVALSDVLKKRLIAGDNYYQLNVSPNDVQGAFETGESIVTDVILDDGTVVNVRLQTVSELKSITVFEGGASYNVGDPVLVRGPSTRRAVARVETIITGAIEDIRIDFGGAGFKRYNQVITSGTEFSNSIFNAYITSVDTLGIVTPNSISIYNDSISDYTSVTLDAADYGFPSAIIATPNINSELANSLTLTTINDLGPVTSIDVTKSTIYSRAGFDILSNLVASNSTTRILDLGIIGRIDINNGGNGYVVNDEIVFTKHYDDYSGRDANAYISQVDANGTITQVRIRNGGLGYDQLNPPTLTVNSSNVSANGANLSIRCFMGDGEQLEGLLPLDANGNQQIAGQVKTIKILDAGLGYSVLPLIDLTTSGNGKAKANAEIRDAYEVFPGRWLTSDSILSSDDRRIQGADYYANFTYLINSKVEFLKYKKIFKELLHPAGMKQYAEYDIKQSIETPTPTTTNFLFSNTVAGLVSVTNNSIYVTGYNTKFNIANTRGIISIGSNISINNQTRTINSIISNTSLTVSAIFTQNSVNQEMILVNS